MVNAQEWLDKNYPKEERKAQIALDFSFRGLEGDLDLSDFVNLVSLACSYNHLTSLDISKNTKLTKLICDIEQYNAPKLIEKLEKKINEQQVEINQRKVNLQLGDEEEKLLEGLINAQLELNKVIKKRLDDIKDYRKIYQELEDKITEKEMGEIETILSDCEELAKIKLENYEQVNIIFPPQLVKVRVLNIKGGLVSKKKAIKSFPEFKSKNQGSSFLNALDQEVIEYFHEEGSKMEGIPSTILEQQEKNKNYVLNNFDKYMLNHVGNIFYTETKILNTNDANYVYIEQDDLTPEGYEAILKKFVKKMINEKDNWEINWTFDFPHKHGEYKHSSGNVIWANVFTEKQNDKLMLVLNRNKEEQLNQILSKQN